MSRYVGKQLIDSPTRVLTSISDNQEMSFWQQRQQRLQQSSLASTPTLRPSKTSPVHTTQQRTPLQDIAPANGAAPDSRASLDTYKARGATVSAYRKIHHNPHQYNTTHTNHRGL